MITKITGNILEGGGQIVRISLSMSALCNKAVDIENIRAGRPRPGLAAQHLHGVLLLQKMCNATVDGALLKSVNLLFVPGSLKSGSYSADTKTAGSIALLLQVSLPCCLFSDGVVNLTLNGGTNADMAPQIEYTTRVFLPILQKFGVTCTFVIKKRGFYPAGKGSVNLRIHPLRELKAINLIEFGELAEVTGEAFYAGKIPKSVAESMALTASTILKSRLSVSVKIRVTYFTGDEAYGSGCGVNLTAHTSTGCILGSSQIGRAGVPAQQLGQLAAEKLLEDILKKVCVDEHLQDQLMVYMALAAGSSAIRTGDVTLHTRTAIHIIQQMCDAEFRIKEDGDCNIIECDGIGLMNHHALQ